MSKRCVQRVERVLPAGVVAWQSAMAASGKEVTRIARATVGLFLCVMACGCGYNLVGKASNLPEDVRSIYVAPLTNATSRTQVDQILTRAISDEMVTRRRFNVVNTEDEADAVLRGTVLGFGVRPLTFDSDGLANSFEITITADMKFQRAPRQLEEEGEVLWSNSRYAFREDYPLEDAGAAFFDRENLAIEETSTRFAETLITDLLEGF